MSELIIPSFASHLPERFQSVFADYWQEFKDSLAADQIAMLARCCRDEAQLAQMAKVWCSSDYVRQQIMRQPHLLFDLVATGDLKGSYKQGEIYERLSEILEDVDSEQRLGLILRLCRQREIVRLIWREQNGLARLEEVTGDLSDFADAAVSLALDWLYKDACKTLGTPMDDQGQPQQLVVLGMGKLGAGELNLSSDIDLIFAYPQQGCTQGGPRSMDNQQFFNRLGQRLIKLLDEQTAEGFVFRVDMRLRPYGQSGALTYCFDALSQYYQTQGRDWERYAMIKARVMAGDQRQGQSLLQELRPFVFRRYLDFGAFSALREMKALIRKEERRRGWKDNIKVGSGGIREIEFIAQMFQLVYGGREQSLQKRRVDSVLKELASLGMLPEEVARQLYQDYRFLRHLEHAIQAVHDQQTQQLPSDELDQAKVCLALGITDWQELLSRLNALQTRVSEQFNQLIEPSDEDDESSAGAASKVSWSDCWPPGHEAAMREQLEKGGFDQPQRAAELLMSIHRQGGVQTLSAEAHQRLDRFIPLLLSELVEQKTPTQALQRVLSLVEKVLKRSAYLVLLSECPQALKQLVLLCATSPWITNELSQHPVLLDDLLDERQLYQLSSKADLQAELQHLMLSVPEGDVEQQMDTLRHFRRSQVLRIAASDVTGVRPLMKVSDALTEVAEVVLEHVLHMAWQHVVERHGEPLDEQGNALRDQFIIVAYGKLGGCELGYGSDLDLVFIYDAPASCMTSGERSIENAAFFTRLGKRLLHMLTTYTYSGQLYDVDMRLRPSGNSGLLVSSLDAFDRYQHDQAWVWEHQALVRARVVAGSQQLAQQFEQVRQKTLTADRDVQALKQEVIAMRLRILDAKGLEHKKKDRIDLKCDRGGVVDIEFIVQYAVLAWSQRHPQLLVYRDNIRILEALVAENLMSETDAKLLQDAYILFRSQLHQRSITEQASEIDLLADDGLQIEKIQETRAAVSQIWQKLMLTA